MAVVVEPAPAPNAAAGADQHRRRLRPVVVLQCLGALMAITGMALALYFSVAPIRITVHQQVPVEQASGEQGTGLIETGQTAETARVTCVPLMQFDSSADQNSACKAKVHDGLGAALAGLVVFVIGGALWVATHGDRAVGFSERRPFIRNTMA